ncbi:MAG: hypothetical protein OS112_00600 [Methanoregula sp.]|nr:MAG: hypothetical protein OS112_00600 [Methanoregula sp.]
MAGNYCAAHCGKLTAGAAHEYIRGLFCDKTGKIGTNLLKSL